MMDDRGTDRDFARAAGGSPDYALLVHSPARRELEAARRSVAADFRRLHGREPSPGEVDGIIAMYWWRISDAAHELVHHAIKRRERAAQQLATEIKVRAERRCGEMLREAAARGERDSGRGDKRAESQRATPLPTLSDLALTKSQSSRYQKLAAMPEEHFEAAVATAQIDASATCRPDVLPTQPARPQRLPAARLCGRLAASGKGAMRRRGREC